MSHGNNDARWKDVYDPKLNDTTAAHRNINMNKNRKRDQPARLRNSSDGVRLCRPVNWVPLRDESLASGSVSPQMLHRQTAFDTLSGMEGCIWGTPAMQDAAHKLCHKSNVTIRGTKYAS